MAPRTAAPIAVLALGALIARVAGAGQSLFGDELFTHHIVTRSSFLQVLAMDGPGQREATPPLFFALSWLSAQLGDPLVWVRGPSVILGTAAVPVVYLLGLRTVGRTAALVGAAVVALSPFAIFYSIEARAYSTLLLLTALSTLALVAAVETTKRGWWALFALCSCAALYTHYTAIFVLAVQVVWAALAYRSCLRELLTACLAIGLLFAPWLTRYPDQREAAAAVEVGVAGRSPAELADDLWRLVVGHPFLPLDQIPGVPALVMGAAGLGVAVASGLVMLSQRRRDTARSVRPSTLLLLALGVALPVGLSLFGVVGKDVYNPKTIFVCLPAVALLIGYLVSQVRWWLKGVVLVLVAGGLTLGTIKALDPSYRRPPWNEAARSIEARASADDVVRQFDPVWYASNDFVALRSLEIHLDGRRVAFPRNDEAADRGARGQRVFFAAGRLPGTPPARIRPAGHRLVHSETFAGFNPVTVLTYAPVKPRADR